MSKDKLILCTQENLRFVLWRAFQAGEEGGCEHPSIDELIDMLIEEEEAKEKKESTSWKS